MHPQVHGRTEATERFSPLSICDTVHTSFSGSSLDGDPPGSVRYLMRTVLTDRRDVPRET